MNWHKVELKKIADVSSGQGAPQGDDKFSETGVPFVRAGSMEHLVNGGSLLELELVQNDVAEEYSLKLHPKNTILFAKSGMSAKKDRVYCLPEPSYVVNHLATIIPDKKEVDPSFLSYYFKVFKPSSLIRDTSYPSIRITDIRKVQVTLPPLETQEKIAAVLDKADALRQKRRQTIKKLDEFTQSVFLDMFGDIGNNPKDFPTKTIGSLIFETHRENPNKTSKKYTYISISDISNEKKKVTGHKIVDKSNAPSRARQIVEKNDIIISTVRPYLNGVAHIKTNLNNPIVSTGFCVLRTNNDLVNPYYLFEVTKSNYFIKNLELVSKGASYPAVTDFDILSLEIPLPSIQKQNEYKSKIQAINKLKKKFKIQLADLDQFFNSLLQKAFKGELNFSETEEQLLAAEEAAEYSA